MIKAIVAAEIIKPNTAIAKANKDTTIIDFITMSIAIITIAAIAATAIVIAFVTKQITAGITKLLAVKG